TAAEIAAAAEAYYNAIEDAAAGGGGGDDGDDGAEDASGDQASGAADEPKVEVDQTPKMSLLELLLKGGYFMIPIAGCSLLGLTVIIERFIALRHSVIIPPGFMAGLKGAFRHTSQDRQAGLDYCHANDCPIARVAAAGIRKLHRPEESVEQAIEDAGANEVAKLRRNLRVLFGVSAVSPMLGLLGTVWGMIQAFQVASLKGLGRAESLATGIYEALVTTFGGLCVAIPVLIFYYYFQGRIEHIVSMMNDVSVEFLDHYSADEELAAK
ncbi:hypothetical protein LCGC14_2471320, partial [marine sediment metagenome]